VEKIDVDASTSFDKRNTDSMSDCGWATMNRCYYTLPYDNSPPHDLYEEISRIHSAEVCQWFCTDVYSPNCTWFLYDKTTLDCKLFDGPQENFYADCKEVGFAEPGTSFSECLSPFGSANDDICYHFREDYCRFEWDLLDNLEYVDNITHCQAACKVNKICNFYTFVKDRNICKLHSVDLSTRICDITHGPPSKKLQDCKNENKVIWASNPGK
jgi:hypothetical protein